MTLGRALYAPTLLSGFRSCDVPRLRMACIWQIMASSTGWSTLSSIQLNAWKWLRVSIASSNLIASMPSAGDMLPVAYRSDVCSTLSVDPSIWFELKANITWVVSNNPPETCSSRSLRSHSLNLIRSVMTRLALRHPAWDRAHPGTCHFRAKYMARQAGAPSSVWTHSLISIRTALCLYRYKGIRFDRVRCPNRQPVAAIAPFLGWGPSRGGPLLRGNAR